MKNESLKSAEKFFSEMYIFTMDKSYDLNHRFTSFEMCHFAATFHENEFNTKILHNYSDAFENKEIIKLLKEREEIESKILAIDTMAIVRYELQKLDQQ